MVNPRQKIVLQGGEVDLLLTPSLYKRTLTKGVDLVLHDPTDAAEVWQIYVKHIYLAYLNALDVAVYDGARRPKNPYTLADFEAWAAGEGKERFAELMAVLVEFKTGKTLEELAEESKKKEPGKERVTFRSWRRGSHAGTGS